MKTLNRTMIALAALSLCGAVGAAEKLRVADSLPVDHYISGNLVEPWMKKVTELTDGEVTFEYYPAEQMGKAKDLLSLLQSGAIDIAYVGISYTPDKLPLSSVGELPEAYDTSCQGSLAYWQLMKPGGLLYEEEIAKQQVYPLMGAVLAPYQIMTGKKKKITDLASIKGLSIRATGDTKELAVARIGATPVSIPAPETRESLARGTVDGAVFPFSSAIPYSLNTVVKYSTHGLNMGSFVVSYMINQNRWNQLSPEVQKIMTEAGESLVSSACAAFESQDSVDEQKMEDSGVEMVNFSDEDKEKLEDLLAGIGEDWATHMDKSGKKGTVILDAFRAELAKTLPSE